MNTPEKPSKPVKAPKPKATQPKVTKPRVSKPKAPLPEGAPPRRKRATPVKKTVSEPQIAKVKLKHRLMWLALEIGGLVIAAFLNSFL